MNTRGTLPNAPYPGPGSEVTSREISLDEERVRIVEAGSREGFPVVLLHGWGASAYNCRAVIGPLARAGYRVIVPDLRGHGGSDTRIPAGAWTRQAVCSWVRSLLNALDVRRCVLVGQSIGGAIALDAAAAMPERVPTAILLTPIGFTPVRRVVLARWLRWIHPSHTPRWVVSMILRRIYGTRGQWSDADLDAYWLPLQRSDVLAAILQSAREFDFTPRDPSAFHGPHLVIRFGELDRLIPHAAAMRQASRYADADAAVLPGVGHVPAEEVPDEISALILRVADEVARE